ncbi:MAG: trypsin-like peptidase domain-containing protein, partial [Nocardiopsaceae bacterium]|nr:trypsin-like peptidase domain-containing protein [Nocardiopsaceae bacterium]
MASGFILWTTGKRAYLVTNQHAVEDQRDLTVTVSTGKGELTVPGTVLDRPSPEQIVEQLVAHNATQGLDRAELLEAVDELDLAVVVIEHRRLARLGLEPIRLHDSLDGANLQAVTLGYPDPSIPVGPDGTPLSTDTDVLVASGGLTLFGPAGRTGAPHRRFDLIIVGDRAASEGNSGAGVILNVTHPDGHVEDVLIGVSRAQIDSRIGRISKAVRADVVRAFLYAHGLTEPTGSSRGGPARLSGQAQTGDVSSAIADSPVAESVSPARLRALGGQVGVPRRLFRAAGMPGLDAHHGFNRAVVTGTGMDDLVIHSGADGRMHTDTEVWTVLRQLALTHPKIVRALLVHELTHLAHPEWTEEQVQAAAPLPTRWPARLRAAIEGLVEGELQPEADPTAGLLAPIPGVGVRSSSRHGPSGEEEGYDNWEIRELQGLPELPADAGEPVLGWVRLWRAATFELISGERDGPAVTELLEKTGRTPSDLPKLVRHRSWDKLTSDQFKYLDVAGEYRVEVAADGTRELHLFPNLRGDGLEVYALVATHFAAWAGLRPEQVPWVARLAVSGGTGREKLWISSEWIPLRVLADLRSLGSYIDRVTAAFHADSGPVMAEIRDAFPETGTEPQRAFGRAVLAYAAELAAKAEEVRRLYQDEFEQNEQPLPVEPAGPTGDLVLGFHRHGELDEERFWVSEGGLESSGPDRFAPHVGQLRVAEIDALREVLPTLTPTRSRRLLRMLPAEDADLVVVSERELAAALAETGVDEVPGLLHRLTVFEVDGHRYTTDTRVRERQQHVKARRWDSYARDRFTGFHDSSRKPDSTWRDAREHALRDWWWLARRGWVRLPDGSNSAVWDE